MNDTRQRILGAASGLFRRQGYTGTGMKQVATGADAPFGSLYHFFPGGKQQLGVEVIHTAGTEYGRLVLGHLRSATDGQTDQADWADAIEDGFAQAAAELERTDYADACPIATVALEIASTDDRLRGAVDEVFTGWIEDLARWFVDGGVEETRARELSLEFIAAMEGAFVLCRAMRSTESLRVVGAAVAASTRAALATG